MFSQLGFKTFQPFCGIKSLNPLNPTNESIKVKGNANLFASAPSTKLCLLKFSAESAIYPNILWII